MDTSHDHEHHHAAVNHSPQPGQRRRVLRIGPVIGRCVAVMLSPKLRRVRPEPDAWLLRHGG